MTPEERKILAETSRNLAAKPSDSSRKPAEINAELRSKLDQIRLETEANFANRPHNSSRKYVILFTVATTIILAVIAIKFFAK
jgi:hypothetical protein